MVFILEISAPAGRRLGPREDAAGAVLTELEDLLQLSGPQDLDHRRHSRYWRRG